MNSVTTGLLVTIVLVFYWQIWHRRSTTAKKRYLVISFIGFLMAFGIRAVPLLPEPLVPLVIATTITGFVLVLVFGRKFQKS